MFKSKGAILGIAVTAVASVLLFAGMGITGTAGAGTDLPGTIGGGPGYPLTGGSTTSPGAPPQSPIEQPIINPSVPATSPDATTPGGAPTDSGVANDATGGAAGADTGVANDATGGQADASSGPNANALPDAGYGAGQSGGVSMGMLLAAVAGLLLAGAGATVVGATRRA